MNTLQDLNTRNLTVSYTDSRPPMVYFDKQSAEDSSRTIYEGVNLTVEPGIEIVDVSNFSVAQPYYQIDVSSMTGATVTWPTIPEGCIVTNVSTGVYKISIIDSAGTWQQVRSPIINIPNNISGEYTYTAKIQYNGTSYRSWSTALTIIDVTLLTTPSTMEYQVGVQNSVTGVPQIIDPGSGTPTYTLTITPSVTSVVSLLSTTGTGGTSSFNSTTKVLTLTGTRTQVNSRLSTLKFTAPSSADYDVNFVYSVVSSLNEADSKTQVLTCAAIKTLGRIRGTITYNEDTLTSVTNGPLITDSAYSDSTGYTMDIKVVPSNAVYSMSSSGSGGTSTWNNSAKTLTLTGTRAQINARIDAISMRPSPDYASNFSLEYKVTTPRTTTVTKSQSMLIGSTNIEITNMDITRNFEVATTDYLFASNIPQITDTDPYATSYTGEFISTSGKFSYPVNFPTTPYEYSGPDDTISLTMSKANWNNFFELIKYTPNDDIFLNHTITYNQYKSDITTGVQLTKTINMEGPDIAFSTTEPLEGRILAQPNSSVHNFVGVDLAINNPSVSISLTVDCRYAPGMTADFDALPSGVTLSEPVTKLYVVSGITTTDEWNAVKSPMIVLDGTASSVRTITSTIEYTGGSLSWNTGVVVEEQVNTNSSILASGTSDTYIANSLNMISGGASVTSTESGTYTLKVYATELSAITSITKNYNSKTATNTINSSKSKFSGDGNILFTNYQGYSISRKDQYGNWDVLYNYYNISYPTISKCQLSDDGKIVVQLTINEADTYDLITIKESAGDWIEVNSFNTGLSTLPNLLLSGNGYTLVIDDSVYHLFGDTWIQDTDTAVAGATNLSISTDGSSMVGLVGTAVYTFTKTSTTWSKSSTSITTGADNCAISGDGNCIFVVKTYNNVLKYTLDSSNSWVYASTVTLSTALGETFTFIYSDYAGDHIFFAGVFYDYKTTYSKDVYNIGDTFSSSNAWQIGISADGLSFWTPSSNYNQYDFRFPPDWSTGSWWMIITGTKSQITSYLGNLLFLPGKNYTDNFTLRYILTTPSGQKARVDQTITNAG